MLPAGRVFYTGRRNSILGLVRCGYHPGTGVLGLTGPGNDRRNQMERRQTVQAVTVAAALLLAIVRTVIRHDLGFRHQHCRSDDQTHDQKSK